MAYAYLVVTLDISANPPRAIRAGIFASGAATLPPQEGRFQFDVMTASGRDFTLAKHNLYTISKVEQYSKRAKWAFELLPDSEVQVWRETKGR